MRRVVLPRDVGPDGFIIPPVRRPGLHLSGLLKYVATKSRITARLQEIEEEEFPLRWLMGHAWEEFAASLYPDMVWQPGEQTEPLIMNADGLTIGGENIIEEFKFNRSKKYSGPNLIGKKWLWMQQGLGMCLGYGTDLVRWHVLSAFEFPDPIYTKYLIRFSDQEIREMQTIIDVNRESAIKEGYAE